MYIYDISSLRVKPETVEQICVVHIAGFNKATVRTIRGIARKMTACYCSASLLGVSR